MNPKALVAALGLFVVELACVYLVLQLTNPYSALSLKIEEGKETYRNWKAFQDAERDRQEILALERMVNGE